jgi:hypothetical protein
VAASGGSSIAFRATFRNYSEEVEALSVLWSATKLTPDRWTILGKVSALKGKTGSESQPDIAQCGPLQCVVKPGEKKTDDKPRAALEKIASDIAFELGLSVAPVILWDRANIPGNQEQYVCLVAWAFEPAFTWEEAETGLGTADRNKAARDISAIWPFETWIAAQDRGGKHLLVGLPNAADVPQTANIDYAFSMLDVWGNNPDHPDVVKPGWCAPIPPDRAAIMEVITRIENMRETTLRKIIDDIPEGFLQKPKKEVIIANLLNRQRKIRTVYSA